MAESGGEGSVFQCVPRCRRTRPTYSGATRGDIVRPSRRRGESWFISDRMSKDGSRERFACS
jgi:hypothetical protein